MLLVCAMLWPLHELQWTSHRQTQTPSSAVTKVNTLVGYKAGQSNTDVVVNSKLNNSQCNVHTVSR